MGFPMTDACLASPEHDYASPANQHIDFKTDTLSGPTPAPAFLLQPVSAAPGGAASQRGGSQGFRANT